MLHKWSDNNSILLRLYTSQHNIKCGSINNNNNKKHIHTADTRTTQNIEFFSHLFLLTVVKEKNHFFSKDHSGPEFTFGGQYVFIYMRQHEIKICLFLNPFTSDCRLWQLGAADIYLSAVLNEKQNYYSSCRQQRNRNHRVYYQFVEKNQKWRRIHLCRLPTLRKRRAQLLQNPGKIFINFGGRIARRSRMAGNGWIVGLRGFFLSSQQMKFWRENEKFDINMVTGIICLYWISW